MLVLGAVLLLAGGLAFAATPIFAVLLVAATVGVISPSGNEVGPFLAVEQAALSQLVEPARRTSLFARYQVDGCAGDSRRARWQPGSSSSWWPVAAAGPSDTYRAVIVAYALVGIVLAAVFWRCRRRWRSQRPTSTDQTIRTRLGLHRSQRRRAATLGAVRARRLRRAASSSSSFIAFWFSQRFGVDAGALGAILFGANLLAGVSALAAAPLAARFGLIRTMVFTHLPSNVLLILVPLMPTLPLAVARAAACASASARWTCPPASPTRWPSSRPTSARPRPASPASRAAWASRSRRCWPPRCWRAPRSRARPFVIAGGLKIVYDLLLYRGFRAARPPEEQP